MWSYVHNVLYPHYRVINSNYTASYAGTNCTTFRIIDVPEIYYDREILSGTFTASDYNADSELRAIYDNGMGGLYSGSMTGTIVGNIFYAEGLVVIKKTDLLNFGTVSATNNMWFVSFKGVNNIPVKIFKCRAPSSELNCSTNPTFYQEPKTGDFKGEKQIVRPNEVYITEIGLYNKQYQLIGYVKLGQPIRKQLTDDLLFRVKIDW